MKFCEIAPRSLPSPHSTLGSFRISNTRFRIDKNNMGEISCINSLGKKIDSVNFTNEQYKCKIARWIFLSKKVYKLENGRGYCSAKENSDLSISLGQESIPLSSLIRILFVPVNENV